LHVANEVAPSHSTFKICFKLGFNELIFML
jgi:hypothetical protein